MELNRGDQDEIPARKFDVESDRQEFGMDGKTQMDASLIEEKHDWQDWQSATRCEKEGAAAKPRHNFLRFISSKPYENEGCAKALLQAISTRALRIYREWYDALDIGSLFEAQDSDGAKSGQG